MARSLAENERYTMDEVMRGLTTLNSNPSMLSAWRGRLEVNGVLLIDLER